MPLQSTSGAASYDAFGGGAAAKVNYIEDCFVSWLSTGNGTSRTVTGPDMTTGGLSITKSRSAATGWHFVDTARGAGNSLSSNTTAANASESTGVTAFTATGTSIGAAAEYNTNGATYVDYLLKKQPKFFDIVTYTGNGSGAGNIINHNLGSTPGFIICKATSTTGPWAVCARTGGAASPESAITYATGLSLNATGAAIYSGTLGSFPTSTTFDATGIFDNGGNYPNVNGVTYIAYLFAHNAGGFPVSGGGSTNGISCGSFTPSAGGSATVTLGYEPQWILVKATGTTGNWTVIDTMRDYSLGGNSSGTNDYLRANTSGAELEAGTGFPTATGFFIDGVVAASQPHIYIAIRRGPMKTPTVGTSVFNGIARTGNGTATTVSNSGFTPDMVMSAPRVDGPSYGLAFIFDRLRGPTFLLETRSTQATQTAATALTGFDVINGYIVGLGGTINANAVTYINWNFKRAPSFFDEVCYTGSGADPQTVSHNLGVAPELMIFKARDVAAGWRVWGGNMAITSYLALSETSAVVTGSTFFGSTLPTSTSFFVGSGLSVAARTIVAYLFATCPGVSKVGSYTGTGAAQTINCGFTAGSRFVLIKRTDSTGDWYVWDSARGIVSGNDPYLLLNSTAAEVTSTDYIDTYSAGFEISSTAPAAINASGGTFIFLAIA